MKWRVNGMQWQHSPMNAFAVAEEASKIPIKYRKEAILEADKEAEDYCNYPEKDVIVGLKLVRI